MLNKFSGLATSGRHNYAMITNAEKLTAKWSPTGCIVSIFTVRINSVVPWGSTLLYKKTFPVRSRETGSKSRLIWKLRAGNRADNSGIIQS